MDQFIIEGGNRLRGKVSISGAKNAALPIMAACLLTEGECVIHSAPVLEDVGHLAELMVELGTRVERKGDTLTIQVTDESNSHARYDLVRKMRASVCVLGPLLAKRGYARVAMPGGCAIGSRPVDIHLRGLAALGAKLELKEGDIVATCKKLKGAEIFLGGAFGSTVTGTANVMMAATLAKGVTLIESAACEPEIQNLAQMLVSMGARIEGIGTPRLSITGVKSLQGTTFETIPDRIEAGTLLMAGALCGGRVTVENICWEHLMAVLFHMEEMGVRLERSGERAITVDGRKRFRSVDVTTLAFPGYPTDLQAQLMTLLCLTDGISVVTEKIYPDRFMHVAELNRMGAEIRKENNMAVVHGVKRLSGAPVMASDLRASAALVLAGLVADGQTEVRRIYHLDRGYENLDQKLRKLGARITRKEQPAGELPKE